MRSFASNVLLAKQSTQVDKKKPSYLVLVLYAGRLGRAQMACTVREQNGLNAVVDYDNGDKYEGVWNANLCKKEGFGKWSSAWIELRLPYSRHTLTPFPCTRSGKKGDVYNGPFLDDKKDGKHHL